MIKANANIFNGMSVLFVYRKRARRKINSPTVYKCAINSNFCNGHIKDNLVLTED